MISQTKTHFGTRLGRVLMNLYVIMASLGCIFPIIWLFYSSLKTQSAFDLNNYSLPTNPTFENYFHVLRTSNMPKYILNSIVVSIFSVLMIIIISFIVGYFLSRFRFKGRTFIFNLFLIGLLIPVHSIMVPMYVIFSKMHINDHLFALMLPYVCFQIPIGIYLAESYIHSIPFEMEDAASIDGASFSNTLFKIIFPMVKPVLVTVGIIAFFFCWNEFSFALILTTGEKMRTVPLGLALFQGSFTTNYPVLMAAMIIATLPTLLLYSIFSKKIMDGMVAGAVKG